jgi:uncharacterized protein YegL
MRDDFSDITIVVDRSGSMASIRKDAEGGINTFIADQAKAPGEAVLTLVQFDDKYEFVHTATPLKDVPPYALNPRGSTALLDAVGRAITETGERLAKMDEAQRPKLVAFVIVTDGHENASREFTLAKVREAITEQRDKYNWQFTFLGADDAAFQGGQMGLHAGDIGQYSAANSRAAYANASSKLGRARTQSIKGQSLSTSFTDEERTAMS